MSLNLSDNYYLRKHYLETNEVPTQSLIKHKMTGPLADVYFKTMTPKLKVMVGLEPPMKGGGTEWYVPPKELLKGRTVLKPIKKEYLSKLNYNGIDTICMNVLERRIQSIRVNRDKIIADSDKKWKETIEAECAQFYEAASATAVTKNTEILRNAFKDFSSIYTTSITSIETMLFDSADDEIKKIQNEAYRTMNDKYKNLVKQQATTLYDEFTNKMTTTNYKLKCDFVEMSERYRTAMGDTIHDLNLEKHVIIEKCRKFLECQRLACQVYVALKEREECEKEMKLSKHLHLKVVKTLADEIALKDFEVTTQTRKEKVQLEYDTKWRNKVGHIVKKFQMIVSYFINLLPEHTEFFINMEKLMLLQLDKALENPSAESIFETEEFYQGPRPEPHPFYIFCDKRHASEPRLKKDLCPKRCTSSASHMPVIVIDKRCMYLACDNFEQFTNKMKSFIRGKRGDDMDFTDLHVYEHSVPVKYTSSQQLTELKLESSLLQVLQQELTNIRNVPIACSFCKLDHCLCDNTKTEATKETDILKCENAKIKQSVSQISATGNKSIVKNKESQHKSEPKWKSYSKYIEPKQCKCAKTAKKHLSGHLPVYMRNRSVYDMPNLPNYEVCPLVTLERMVLEARGSVSDLPTEEIAEEQTRDMATQYSDLQYEAICTCFSDDELHRLMEIETGTSSKICHKSATGNDVVVYYISDDFVTAQTSSLEMD